MLKAAQREYIEQSFDEVGGLLLHYMEVIGADYRKYHHHVCRVVGNCLLIDGNESNRHKYVIAGVFHDIGIWTNHTIDYLAPSVSAAVSYLNQSNQAELISEVIEMINWHHKTTSYKGRFSDTVNCFRKADWIDVSLGTLSFGTDSRLVAMNRIRFPNCGFHAFLIRKLAVNFLKHPLSPLPMFRL
jgi:hypothetical protein